MKCFNVSTNNVVYLEQNKSFFFYISMPEIIFLHGHHKQINENLKIPKYEIVSF